MWRPHPKILTTRSITARGLVKRFGTFTAVDGIDVDVRRGEAFGFLGPNGAGESSTMRMIGATSPVTGGTLRISGSTRRTHGREIRAWRPRRSMFAHVASECWATPRRDARHSGAPQHSVR